MGRVGILAVQLQHGVGERPVVLRWLRREKTKAGSYQYTIHTYGGAVARGGAGGFGWLCGVMCGV